MIKQMKILFIFSLAIYFANAQISYQGKVLLRDVSSLSFKNDGIFTTSRKGSRIPKMNCESGLCEFGPNNILCKNVGLNDENDVVWECTGYGLTDGYKLTHSDVSCEGYDYPEDPYIVSGSCGLYYGIAKNINLNNNIFDSHESVTTETVETVETVNDFKQPWHPKFRKATEVENFINVLLIFLIFLIAISIMIHYSYCDHHTETNNFTIPRTQYTRQTNYTQPPPYNPQNNGYVPQQHSTHTTHHVHHTNTYNPPIVPIIPIVPMRERTIILNNPPPFNPGSLRKRTTKITTTQNNNKNTNGNSNTTTSTSSGNTRRR